MLACLYANSHRDPGKRSQPFSIDDFLPSNGVQTHYNQEEQSVEEQVAIMKRWAMNQPGFVRRPNGA